MPSWLPSSVKSIICSKLESELDRTLKSLEGIRSSMVDDIEDIEDLLSAPGKLFRTLGDSMSDVNDMLQGLDNVVPDLTSINSISSVILFLERCLFLKDHPVLSNAYKMAQQLLDEYLAMADEYIQQYSDYMDNYFPTNINIFNISDRLSSYKDKLNKYKITQKYSDAGGILLCMNSICKLDESDNIITEAQSYINTKQTSLDNLKTQLRITDDGSLDVDGVLSNAGINTEEKLIMNNTLNAVEHTKETFKESQKNMEAATKGEDLPYPSTDLYTHYNEPTIYSTSLLFDQVDPTITYESDFLDTWSELQLPSGTTTKRGMVDVRIEIDECTITETPDPNVNCFSTYTSLVKIIIGFSDCSLSGDGSITTVTQVNHGYSTDDIIIISDATNDVLEGPHTITVTNDHVYTFTSIFNGTDEAKASSVYKSVEGVYRIGIPVCGVCGEYNKYGISSATNEDLYYIRKNLAESVKTAIENTMVLFTSTEIEDIIPDR